MKMRKRNNEGFTILELMVALTVGAMAISAVYFLGSASSWHFQQQQRISQTQMSLRMAMEQLRRDVARAGFMGTPNSRTEQRCATPSSEIQAVEYLSNADTAALPRAAENLVDADRIRLIGNYATSEGYLATGLDATGSRIFLQENWQAFRRSFGDPFSETAFTDVFRVGRMLHIRTLQGNHFFVSIRAVDAASNSIEFAPSLTIGGHCVVGLADGAIVAPLNRIEYLVADMSTIAQGTNLDASWQGTGAAGDAARGLVATQLVRREIAFPDGDAAADATTPDMRFVLEFVADLDFEFVFDRAAVGAAPDFARLAGDDAVAQFALAPQSVRSVVARLSARTADHDRQFPWVAREDGDPLTRYRVTDAVPGAARVRTMQTEIFLPNLAFR